MDERRVTRGGNDDDDDDDRRRRRPPHHRAPASNDADAGDGTDDDGGVGTGTRSEGGGADGVVAAAPGGDGDEAAGGDDAGGSAARYRRGDRVYARDDSDRRGVYEATVREVEHRCHRSGVGIDPDEDDQPAPRFTYRYLVHYLGWNKKWDRWVDEADVMDIDSPEGRGEAERLREEDRVAKERERVKREQKRENKKKKRQQQLAKQQGDDDGDAYEEEDVEEASSSSSPLHDLPFTLRTILVDDRENITRRCHQPSEAEWYVGRLLHTLPAPVTVKTALDRYLSEKEKKLLDERGKLRRKEKDKEKDKDPPEKEAVDRDGGAREKDGGGTEDVKDVGGGDRGADDDRDAVLQGWRDTVEGLLGLFDVALPLALLYEQERLQYASAMRATKASASSKAEGGGGGGPRRPRPCEIYGCEHLLRLFVRLPAMMAAARVASSASASASAGPSNDDGNGGDGEGMERRRRPSTGPASAAGVLAMMGGVMEERLGDVVRYLQGNVGRVFRPAYREPRERELTSAERALRERAGRKRARLLEREKRGDEDKDKRAASTVQATAKAGGDARTASATPSR